MNRSVNRLHLIAVEGLSIARACLDLAASNQLDANARLFLERRLAATHNKLYPPQGPLTQVPILRRPVGAPKKWGPEGHKFVLALYKAGSVYLHSKGRKPSNRVKTLQEGLRSFPEFQSYPDWRLKQIATRLSKKIKDATKAFPKIARLLNI